MGPFWGRESGGSTVGPHGLSLRRIMLAVVPLHGGWSGPASRALRVLPPDIDLVHGDANDA